MAIFAEKYVVKSLALSIKRRLGKLIKNKKASAAPSSPLPTVEELEQQRREAEENALNEAMEVRLMELIARTPQQDEPVSIRLGVAPKVTGHYYSRVVVPADPEEFYHDADSDVDHEDDLDDDSFVPVMSRVQTRCQQAQAQQA